VKSSPARQPYRNRSRDRRAQEQTSNIVDSRRWALWLGLLLFAATVALYFPVHGHPFTNFDDGPYVYANQHVQSGLSWDTIKWAFTSIGTVTPDVPDWHPLAWVSHATDTQLFGPDPAGPHDMNVFFHALNVVLLFWVLWRATGALGRSAMVAALFAVHPINVESVAWISERKNLLSMTFFLLALAAYRWYAREPRATRYVVVAVLFALGLMSKPQVITLPFVLLLWDYWPLRRMFPSEATVGSEASVDTSFPKRSLSQLILEKVPLLLLAGISAVITLKSQQAIGSINSDKALSFSLRLGNAIVSYARYLGKAVWPSDLSLFYPHPGTSLAAWQVVIALLVLLAVSAVVMLTARRRYPLVGWLWFLGTMVPMIGLVQLNRQAMADRYGYLPFIGLFLMVCWGAEDVARARRLSPIALRVAAVAVLLALSVVTYRQIGFWGDNMTLWSHALEVTQGNYLAENIVGSTLMDRGDAEAALTHFENAVKENPSDASAYLAIGAYDQKRGQAQQAIEQYQRVITLTDNKVRQNLWLRSTAFARMGSAYRQLKDFENARQNYREALKLDPDKGEVWLALGIVTQLAGDSNGAVQAYSQAVKLQPSDVGYLLLARAMQATGHDSEAQEDIEQARRHSKDFARAQRSVDAVLGQQATATQ
jgi:protein O-mannosyl-transferase